MSKRPGLDHHDIETFPAPSTASVGPLSLTTSSGDATSLAGSGKAVRPAWRVAARVFVPSTQATVTAPSGWTTAAGLSPRTQDLHRAEAGCAGGAAGRPHLQDAERICGRGHQAGPHRHGRARLVHDHLHLRDVENVRALLGDAHTGQPRRPRAGGRAIAIASAATAITSASARALRRRVTGILWVGSWNRNGLSIRAAPQRGPTRNLSTTGARGVAGGVGRDQAHAVLPGRQPLLRCLAVERLRAAAGLQRPALRADLAPLPVPAAPGPRPPRDGRPRCWSPQPSASPRVRSAAGRSQAGARQHRRRTASSPAGAADACVTRTVLVRVVALPLPSVAVTRTS